MATADSRQNAALAHVLGIVTGFVAPLIIFLIKKDDPFVRNNAREALNFQITAGAIFLINNIMGWIAPLWIIVGWLVPLALFVIVIVWSIQGFQAANAGKTYRYPVAVRLVT